MTASPTEAPVATDGGSSTRRWTRADQRVISVLVVLLVLTQRIGFPVGETQIPVALPISYVCLGLLLARRSLVVSRLRGELFLLAATACIASTTAVLLSGGTVSLNSLMLLIAIYLPWVLRAAGDHAPAVARLAGRTFVRVMLVLAVVGIGQLTSQLAGVWTYEDYLPTWLPPTLLVPGYNTDNVLYYGSDIFKSTAFLMLEPSAFSQFCALAAVIALLLRAPAWQVMVLIGGLASAVSGTGIIVLLTGGILLAVRSPRSLRPSYGIAVAVAAGVAALSPIADVLLNRTNEVAQPQSSGYARFVAPYTEALRGLAADPLRYLTGGGPGMAERLLASRRSGFGYDVLYSIVPKLAFEYGLVAGLLFAVFLVISQLDGAGWRVVPGTLVVMTFFLSGALLQPQTQFLAWAFTVLGSRELLTGRVPAPPEPARPADGS